MPVERVVVVVEVGPDDVDLAADELFVLGASAVSERPAGVGSGTGSGSGSVELVADLPAGRLTDLRRPFRELDTAAATTDAPFTHDPVTVAGFVLVPHPARSEGSGAAPGLEPDRTVWLDPVAAFGSGTHPTTRLCVAAAVDLVRPGSRVIDVGSGNGVLSVVAARCGAASVLALDIDPAARAATADAAVRNGVGDRVQVSDLTVAELAGVLGDEIETELDTGFAAEPTLPVEVGRVADRAADVVLANLLVDVIEANASALVALVGPDGVLVVSGVLSAQVDRAVGAIESAAGATGRSAALRSAPAEGEWRALVFRLGHRRVTAP